MRSDRHQTDSSIAIGAAAGLLGTGVMVALRSFDQHYAPRTIAKTSIDPGLFAVRTLERGAGIQPSPRSAVEQIGATAVHLGYGTTFGLLYGLWRGRDSQRSSLGDGIVLGMIVYALGHLGLLPLLGLSNPIWRQKVPEIGGELFRHCVFGVAVAATFGIADPSV